MRILNFSPIKQSLLILTVTGLYTLFIGRHGWANNDDGFILGMSWRIFNGSTPYKDFIYVRPPLSIYLHSLWFYLFPDNLLYIAARALTALQICIYSFLACAVLVNAYPQTQPSLFTKYRAGFAILSFLLSISVYSAPFPWHTLDGVFMGMLGVYCISRDKGLPHTLLAALAVFLACLAKQSFYPAPLFFMAYLFLNRRRQDLIVYALTNIVLLALFMFWLKQNDALVQFLEQTRGSTTLKTALVAGAHSYLYYPANILAGSILCILFSREICKSFHKSYPPILDLFWILLVSIVLALYFFLKQGKLNCSGFEHTLFLLTLLTIIRDCRTPELRQPALLLALMLALSWCASISWTNLTPIQFAAPLLFGGLRYFQQQYPDAVDQPKLTSWQEYGLLCGLTIISLINLAAPTRDGKRSELSCDLGGVETKLSYIKTSTRNCEKLAEAHRLATQYKNEKVVFLPTFTLAGYLYGTANPLPIDWPIEGEMGKSIARVENALDQQVAYALLDQDETQELATQDHYVSYFLSSPFPFKVHQEWRPVFKGQFFVVYQNPNVIP